MTEEANQKADLSARHYVKGSSLRCGCSKAEVRPVAREFQVENGKEHTVPACSGTTPWSQSGPIRRVLSPCRALSHTTPSLGHCLSLFHTSCVDVCFPQSYKCVYLKSNDTNSRFIWESYLAEEIMCSVMYSWIYSRQLPARMDTRGLCLTAPLMHPTAFSRNRLRSERELHCIIVVLIHIIINLV